MAVASTAAPGDEGATNETERLRESIAETREQIGCTIEALQEKLSPSVLAQQAKTAVREATIGKVENMVQEAEETITRTSYSLYDSMRRNPVPVAMAGIGIAWFFMCHRRERRSHEVERYGVERHGEERYRGEARRLHEGEGIGTRVRRAAGEVAEKAERFVEEEETKVTDAAREAKEKVAGTAREAREKVTGAAREAKERVKLAAREATETGRRLENRVEDQYYQNPLAAGAIAMAAGTAIGLAIPISRKEEQWMGPARDKLVGKANELAQEALGKVEEAARKVEDVAHDVGENVSQVLGEGGTRASQQGSSQQMGR